MGARAHCVNGSQGSLCAVQHIIILKLSVLNHNAVMIITVVINYDIHECFGRPVLEWVSQSYIEPLANLDCSGTGQCFQSVQNIFKQFKVEPIICMYLI